MKCLTFKYLIKFRADWPTNAFDIFDGRFFKNIYFVTMVVVFNNEEEFLRPESKKLI